MKKVLLTNYSLKGYSGSELDTISTANYFLRNGYEVDIFCYEYDNELIDKIDKNIRIIRYHDNKLLNDYYDIIWSHHFPLLYLVLFIRKVKAKYIHYISLSSYLSIESLPLFYKNLSLNSCNSKESKGNFLKSGFKRNKINILYSSFENEWFMSNEPSKVLKKICIISNHLPDELAQVADIMKKNGYLVDIYGILNDYRLVTPDIMKEYDLVISIGRSIYSGLSLNKACYVYDQFGGDGYITKNNIRKSLDYNFSGRYSSKKVSAQEIYEDIINNYDLAIKDLNYCHEFACKNFNLERNYNKILRKMKYKKINNKRLYKNNQKYIKTYNTLIDYMDKWYIKTNNL